MIHRKNTLREDSLKNSAIQVTAKEATNEIIHESEKAAKKIENIRRNRKRHGHTILTLETHEKQLNASSSQFFNDAAITENGTKLRYNVMGNELKKVNDFSNTGDLPKRLNRLKSER
ncbi:hypothetical protein KIN20_011694 [Parelaphostrongylus tenuis]|uniref:Uncharacterized protein n=1 Tax=Parelaphostrongylus tenuis TaxID=148309 RepID=A0AAD5MEF8_PARTN|nr:hypothetical protein KIN20_011694 [Parelaphostrongylus tenuis]